MKTYRILGILWLINSCVGTVTIVRTFMLPAPDAGPGALNEFIQLIFYSILGAIFVLGLIAIAASIFLMRGAKWARWYLGSYAIVIFAGSIVDIRSVTIWTVAFSIFALVSAVLLLKPKRYAATNR